VESYREAQGQGGETHQMAEDDGAVLTTSQGAPIADDQNTLRYGARGPALLEDQHFRDKIFHFDHERIPERVVHSRGYGALGYFELTESLAEVTCADIFQRVGERTEAFVRFSTACSPERGRQGGRPDIHGIGRRDFSVSVTQLGCHGVEIDRTAWADHLDDLPLRRSTPLVHLFRPRRRPILWAQGGGVEPPFAALLWPPRRARKFPSAVPWA
jgi:Catalase